MVSESDKARLQKLINDLKTVNLIRKFNFTEIELMRFFVICQFCFHKSKYDIAKLKTPMAILNR